MKPSLPSKLLLTLLAGLALLLSTPALARGTLPRPFQLRTVNVDGKAYYRTFRVTSKAGLARISDASNSFRFFQGGGQYGDGFYLFHTLRDARRFARCEAARGACSRNVISEVLLPKERFDAVAKSEVPAAADWGMISSTTAPQYSALRELRLSSHLVYGRWAPSPYQSEPVYDPMNGARQIAVIQRGMPSILNEAIIRQYAKPVRPSPTSK